MSNKNNKTIIVAHNTAKYLLMHYRQLLIELNQQFDRVVCVTPKDGHHQEFTELGYHYHPIKMQQHGMNPLQEWQLMRQFVGIYQQYQPDCVLNFSIKPCLYGGHAAKKLNVPKAGYMVTGLGYIFMNDDWKASNLKRLVVKKYTDNLRSNDEVFFQNKDDKSLFSELGIIDKPSTHVLPGTGIDLAEFKPAPRNNDVIDKVRFLFIGRMLKDKGVYELVKACYALKKKGVRFQCDLLGPLDDNPSAIQRDELLAWQQKGLVRYLGEVDDVREQITKSHVFVLPSYREGLPRAGLEAMAMGLPVISTDVPGCRELVEEGENGFLIPAEHSTPLLKAMKKFIDNKSLIQSMGDRSREICEERFSVEIMIDMVRRAMLKNVK